jgi:hypothetical protein
MTRKRDVRIQDFVASFGCFNCAGLPQSVSPHLSRPSNKVAEGNQRVYCSVQDDFYLQPIFFYVPLLALLLEPQSGDGGVASSEDLSKVQTFS